MSTKRTLVWYDGQEGEVDPRELFDLLRTHGFVDGDYRVADADARRRVRELASDLFTEIQASEGERASGAFEKCIHCDTRPAVFCSVCAMKGAATLHGNGAAP